MNTEELKTIIEIALQEIRPYLEADGGNIKLIEVKNDIVSVQLEGACLDCSANKMTLKNGVEETIKRHAPQIKKVIEVSGITF